MPTLLLETTLDLAPPVDTPLAFRLGLGRASPLTICAAALLIWSKRDSMVVVLIFRDCMSFFNSARAESGVDGEESKETKLYTTRQHDQVREVSDGMVSYREPWRRTVLAPSRTALSPSSKNPANSGMNGLKPNAPLFSLIPTTTFIPPTFPRGDLPSMVLMSSLSYNC